MTTAATAISTVSSSSLFASSTTFSSTISSSSSSSSVIVPPRSPSTKNSEIENNNDRSRDDNSNNNNDNFNTKRPTISTSSAPTFNDAIGDVALIVDRPIETNFTTIDNERTRLHQNEDPTMADCCAIGALGNVVNSKRSRVPESTSSDVLLLVPPQPDESPRPSSTTKIVPANALAALSTMREPEQRAVQQAEPERSPSTLCESHKFFIERAVTNKARCRACHKRIDFNEWRFGVSISRRLNNPEPFKSWHHIACLRLSFAQPSKFAKFVVDPEKDIRDWTYIDKSVRQSFVDELAKLKEMVELTLRKKTKTTPSAETESSNSEKLSRGKRRTVARNGHRRTSTKKPRRGAAILDDEANSAADTSDGDDDNDDDDNAFFLSSGKNNRGEQADDGASARLNIVIPAQLFARCRDCFAGITNPNDDSLEAYNTVRQCLSDVNDVKERTGVLRLWFSHGRDGRGFRGDVRLWFRVLVNDCMNRSFGIKNKQLTKFFSTKILHIPLGVIETNVRDIFLRDRRILTNNVNTDAPVAVNVSKNSSNNGNGHRRNGPIDGAEIVVTPDGPPVWLSRSSERRTSNKHLPRLLVEMLRKADNCKFRPRDSSTLTLSKIWSYMERIASHNKEAARNQVLQTLLDECSIDDVEPMLRILFSESGTRFSLRQLITAFMPGVYNDWFCANESPKPNVYNEQRFNALVELMDFTHVSSYKFDHLLEQNFTFDELRGQAKKRRPSALVDTSLCSPAKLTRPTTSDDETKDKDATVINESEEIDIESIDNVVEQATTTTSTTVFTTDTRGGDGRNSLHAATMLVKCAKLLDRCSFSTLENIPLD